ncbi:MAG: type II toxin-antitoxin system death-on-curing family toxin [Patescibacteria group bacterium]|nr:type II toxin-antitoxin system death-on-curing family toxin [Patescibacteria group bacterium]
MNVRYLTAEEIAAIHQRLLEETGGKSGVLDFGLLFSLAEKSKTSFGGQELYQGVFLKAAVLLESLVSFHVFTDCNKRTAFMSAAVFLQLNGWHISIDADDAFKFMLAVANKRKKMTDIEKWLKTNGVKV